MPRLVCVRRGNGLRIVYSRPFVIPEVAIEEDSNHQEPADKTVFVRIDAQSGNHLQR